MNVTKEFQCAVLFIYMVRCYLFLAFKWEGELVTDGVMMISTPVDLA